MQDTADSFLLEHFDFKKVKKFTLYTLQIWYAAFIIYECKNAVNSSLVYYHEW